MSKETVRIVVPGEPVPKERPRAVRGRVYTPRKTQDYEELIAWAVKGQPTFGRKSVVATLRFWCADGRRGDLDNYIKSCLDGLQKGGLFKSDKQVCEIHAWRFDNADDPRTEAEVRAFG